MKRISPARIALPKWRPQVCALRETRGDSIQLAQYVAVLIGVRKAMDDWIPADQFDAFQRVASGLGVFVEIDCVFVPASPDSAIPGIDLVPTTRAFGTRFDPSSIRTNSYVHVVLSMRRDWAQEAVASCWYHLAINGRMIQKPLIDHRRFGLALGYPECCVSFFHEHNDWPRQNTIAEAVRASHDFYWQANCILKRTRYMLIFHMPCRFDCGATRDHGQQVYDAVLEIDPALAQSMSEYLKTWYLSINELTAFGLRGARWLGPNKVSYDAAVRVSAGTVSAREQSYIMAANTIEIRDGALFLFQRANLRHIVPTYCDNGRVDYPVILPFS